MHVYEGWEALAWLMKTLLIFNDEFEKAINQICHHLSSLRGHGSSLR